MTTDIAQPGPVNNIIWLICLTIAGLVFLVATLGEMAWTRAYLKKARERNKPPRNTYHFGMEHEIAVQPIVAEARRQVAQGLNIFRLPSKGSDKAMREYGKNQRLNPGYIVHRTDVDVLYVYTGVAGPDGSMWRPIQWAATQRYLSEVARIAPSSAPVPPPPPPKPAVDLTPAKRKFLPINPTQG
jgi:hypothetical protein